MEGYPPEERNDLNPPEMELEEAITKPDLSNIESKDPLLTDGFKIIYNKEVPLDVKLETKEGPKDLASFEPLRCKHLFDDESKEAASGRVKLELIGESNLLFHYFFIEIMQRKNDVIKE